MKKTYQIIMRYSTPAILIILVLVLAISTACSRNNISNTRAADSTDISVLPDCLPEMPATVSVQSLDQKLAAVIYDQAIGVYETGSKVMLYCLERYPESTTEQSYEYALCEIYEIEFSSDNNFMGVASRGRGYGSHIILGYFVVWDMETGQITWRPPEILIEDKNNFSFSDDSSEVTYRVCRDMMQGMCLRRVWESVTILSKD